MIGFDRIPRREDEIPVRQAVGVDLKYPAMHCRIEHLFPLQEGEVLSPDWIRALTLYLANFCEPVRTLANEVRCVACGTEMVHENSRVVSGKKLSLDPASPTGETRCPTCAYPVRTRHLITTLDRRIVLVKLDFFPLCYHPHSLERAN